MDKKSSEYAAYKSAKGRCERISHKKYPHYGGRGIKFLYNSFAEFLEDIGPKPDSKLSLDRKDNSKHYEIGNCHWTTTTHQNNNKRTNRKITYNNQTLTSGEWGRITNIPPLRIRQRLNNDWSISEALGYAIPVSRKNVKRY